MGLPIHFPKAGTAMYESQVTRKLFGVTRLVTNATWKIILRKRLVVIIGPFTGILEQIVSE